MTRNPHILLFAWLAVIGCIGSPQPCTADTTVTLRPTTEMHRPTVRLSDLFDGVPGAIDRDIASSPQPGQKVVYDATVLSRIAHKYRLDWEPQSLADHVTIATPSTKITADTIRESVIQRVRQDYPDATKDSSDIDVVFDQRAIEINLPADQGPDFTLNNFTYDTVGRHFRTDVAADTATGPMAMTVSGRVMIKRNVPVLSHRLDAGTTIGVADIEWMPVADEKIGAAVITDDHQMIGRELRRDMADGEVLHVQDVMPPRFVKRGTLVTMQIQTPFMALTTQGKALQDGTEGDTVRILNTQSNRMIEGVVTGPDTVTVRAAGQKMAAAQ